MSTDSPDIKTIVSDVDTLKKDVKKLQDGLDANTIMTQKIEKNTSDVVEFFTAMTGAFKVFNVIGSLAKPLAWIIAAIGSLAVSWSHVKTWQIWSIFK